MFVSTMLIRIKMTLNFVTFLHSAQKGQVEAGADAGEPLNEIHVSEFIYGGVTRTHS